MQLTSGAGRRKDGSQTPENKETKKPDYVGKDYWKMSSLNQECLGFDESDVRLMQEMLAKFYEFHRGTATPDWSSNYVAYLPVFAIALLKSQQVTEKLSRRLEWLTWVLVVLTALIAILTLAMVV